MSIQLLFIYLLLITSNLCDENKNDENDEFIPTNDWQVVKKGQKIPKGLHVRINFETGITEAKLLNDDEENDKTHALSKVNENEETTDTKLNSIKEALKNIKAEKVTETEQTKFKSYEEIKKDFESLNLIPKTDAEILKDLIKTHQITTHEKEVLLILEDLEYLSHQYDNANEFVSQNGFKEIIYKNLNHTSINIKSETLKLFGALMQNNAKVQIHALETDGINVLLKILALDGNIAIKNRAVFALSCLLRRFPLAQKTFLNNAGLSVILKTFELSDVKLQLKIITFINDLLIEQKEALEDASSVNYAEKVKQYTAVNLKFKLIEQNWCNKINNLLIKIYEIDKNDYDSIEKCLAAVKFFINDCSVSHNFKEIIKHLQIQFQILALNEKNDLNDQSNYFEHLHNLCKQISDSFLNKNRVEL